MLIYSKRIIQFVREIKHATKGILFNEVGVRVHGDRFYDRAERCSYPINIVIYNNKSMLGYFDPPFYELGFHACLMHTSKVQLHQLIRHELAHYITFITYGEGIQAHGIEFRAFCERMGWGEDVYKATLCLDSEQSTSPALESAVLRKVQKLMALATSSNQHEAEQAMIKSQQLLLKHNLDTRYIGPEEEEQIVLKRIMKQKRENAKMRSIAKILRTFFVTTVIRRTEEFTCLEILGSAVNVEIAEYVAQVLDHELDKLWSQAQKNANLKGMVAKNSFFLGLAKGYCNKIQALKQGYSSDMSRELTVIEKKLTDAEEMVYPRLSSSKSSGNFCRNSSALGEQMGRHLQIHPALHKPAKPSGALIGSR